jgi:hypothetical protein
MEFNATRAIARVLAEKTDEERAEEAKYQSEQREKLGTLTDVELKIQFGRRMVEAVRRKAGLDPTPEQLDRLAEGYALQGDYDQAIKCVQDRDRRGEYLSILSALDGAGCQCTSPKAFLKERIFARGKIVDVYGCTVCGKLRC